jgi:hypothetical protein
MKSHRRLFSYVVDHDFGYAPNADGGNCILSHCKFSNDGKTKNLLESVRVDEWIVGTGGSSDQTAPPDHIVFAMKVEAKLPIEALFSDSRFKVKSGGYPKNGRKRVHGREFAVSFNEFYYFGKKR